MSYETADILDSAADLIERDGWHRGSLVADDGRAVCAMGAIGRACNLLNTDGLGWLPADASDFAPVNAARDALTSVLPGRVAYMIPDWNDAPERTKQEVLDTLRLAAKNERAAEDQP